MFYMRYAQIEDEAFWFTWDRHMKREMFKRKSMLHECYVISYHDSPVGGMRYNLFWDTIPFLNLIYITPDYRGKGLGRYALSQWEMEMKQMGHQLVLTSTMVDEQAQHFYRKLGYRDCGCLVKDIPALRENMELFMMKPL